MLEAFIVNGDCGVGGTLVVLLVAISLVVLSLPKIIALPNAVELKKINQELEAEISSRKQAEATLQQSQESLRLCVEAANLGLWDYDSVSNTGFLSERCRKMYAIPLDTKVTSDNFLNSVHVEDRERVTKTITTALFQGKDFDVEYRISYPDGSLGWLKTRGCAYSDSEGKPTRMAGVTLDITEQKQLEQTLQNYQAQLNDILNTTPVGIISYRVFADRTIKYDYCSQGCEQLCGFTPQELMTNTNLWLSRVFPEDINLIIKPRYEEMFVGSRSTFEYRFLHKNGSLCWFSETLACRQDETTNSLIVTTAIADITERKQAESKLLHNSALLASAERLAHVGSWEYDPNNQKIFWSEETFRIYGIDPTQAEPTLALCLQFVHPDDLVLVKNSFSDIITNGVSQEIEYRIVRHDGSVRYIEGRGEALFNLLGQVTKLFGASIDITERKESEKERLRLLTILEASTDHIGLADCQGNILWNNAQAKKILGLAPDADVTQTNIPEYHPQWALAVVENQGLPIAASEGFWMGETALLPSDGSEMPVSQIIIAHKSPDGEVEYFSTIMRDISEQKRYSLQLQQAKEAAEAANRAKSEFIARMSHELRTPLNSILGFTQIMHRQPCNEPSHLNYLNIINKSGQHLLELINDVLSMSKIEAGRIKLNENSFDLYHLLNSLEELLQIKATAKQLTLTFDIAPDLPQYAIADEGKLRQVLLNLLGNAIKFTTTGTVTLRALVINQEEKQSTIHFDVIDTGLGIAPEEMHNLFSAFMQTETGRNSQEGTGLGLAISRKFVQLMGGDITVQSIVRYGSVFSFDIPVKVVDATQVQTAVLSKTVKSLAPNQPIYRLLIVDDTWEHRHFLEQLLAPLGFQVRSAENGQQAVELWQTWYPHLIFMDMQMPVMNGYDATQVIKATDKGQATAIVALTASAFDSERSVILSSGCDEFISKPFPSSEIFDVLAKALGVRYTYFETAPLEQKSPSSFSLTKSDLAVMSDEWVQQLYQAACYCSDELIFNLLEQIPSEHSALISTLREFTYNFHFDKIIALTNNS